MCDAASLINANISVSSNLLTSFSLTLTLFISEVKKTHSKSETKRYSEIFRDFDNLDLSILSW